MSAQFHELLSQFSENEVFWAWVVGISLLTFVGSLVAVPIVVVRMDADYFYRPEKKASALTPLRLLGRVVKNFLGWILLAMGILMLVLPGQGLLTIALGISLIDFPGKRRLQLRFVQLQGVHVPIDWIRKKAGKPPLHLPEK